MTKSDTAIYKAALKEARAEFDRATERLNTISLEASILTSDIGRLRKTITALAALCSEEPGFDDLGITEACAEVMENEQFELSTTGVVKALEDMGYDLSAQKNAPASVHAILSRMASQGKIKKVKDSEDRVCWRGPKYDPDAIPF